MEHFETSFVDRVGGTTRIRKYRPSRLGSFIYPFIIGFLAALIVVMLLFQA